MCSYMSFDIYFINEENPDKILILVKKIPKLSGLEQMIRKNIFSDLNILYHLLTNNHLTICYAVKCLGFRKFLKGIFSMLCCKQSLFYLDNMDKGNPPHIQICFYKKNWFT